MNERMNEDIIIIIIKKSADIRPTENKGFQIIVLTTERKHLRTSSSETHKEDPQSPVAPKRRRDKEDAGIEKN